MNRKTILTIVSILGLLSCLGVILAWGIYSILNTPTIKAGLDKAGSEFRAMVELQQKVAQTYQSGSVSVQIMNNKALNVSLVNSKFNKMSEAQQAEHAHEIALFVQDNYTGKAKIERVTITFVKNNQVGPISTNWSASYPFDVSELK
jgi:hypothetical protein